MSSSGISSASESGTLSRKRRSEATMVVRQDNNNLLASATANTTKPNAIYGGASKTSISCTGRGGSSSSTTSRRLVVRVKRYHGVAKWIWNANDEVCGICQAAFEGTAPGVKYPGEDCPVVWGKCGHAFHLQCVSKWLSQTSSKNSCPICRQEWEFGSNPTTNSSATNDGGATAANEGTG